MQAEIQLGKNGITDNFIETLKHIFENHDNVRLSVLKSAGHDREKIKEYSFRAHKAEKRAVKAERELYYFLIRESKLHMEVIRLQAKLEFIENLTRVISISKKEALS